MLSGNGAAPATAVVLLVEDNPAVRGLIRMVLENRGYTVLSATDGQQALEVADRYDGRIHLLLSDIDMPHVNGVELAGRIRERRPEIRLLYMSGSAEETDLPLLRKPFALEALERTITAILEPEQPPAANEP